jgi:hypothetical protein
MLYTPASHDLAKAHYILHAIDAPTTYDTTKRNKSTRACTIYNTMYDERKESIGKL